MVLNLRCMQRAVVNLDFFYPSLEYITDTSLAELRRCVTNVLSCYIGIFTVHE